MKLILTPVFFLMGILDWIKNWFSDKSVCHLCGREFVGAGSVCPLCEPTEREYQPQTSSRPASYSPATPDSASSTPETAGSTPDLFSATPRQVDFVPSAGHATKPVKKPKTSRSTVSLKNLDASKFEPISTAEAFELTSGSNWRSAYWDSLSQIPPQTLPRIQVINKTMVGLGLISSQQLARIYELNEQYSSYKSSWTQIEEAATLAIQRSRDQRQRVREQKKQEAAERKRKRQSEIKRRWETDIVFLGRGVSKGLANRQSQVEKLQSANLPVLATPLDVANSMELSIKHLRWLAFHDAALRRTHYVYFDVPRKSGGTRQLAAPQPKMAAAQQWIHENILQKITPHEAAHGFAKGHSIVTNATPHIGKKVIVNVDLEQFFPSINFFRVSGLFEKMGYSPAVATILGLLCTEAPRRQIRMRGEDFYVACGPRALPQGACTSPAISNLISRHLDIRFSALSQKLGWCYTRYADDMTFSCTDERNNQLGYLMARIRHITSDEGFSLNEAKTRILRPNSRQTVTGLVVNDKLSVPRKTIRKVRAILHNAKRTGLQPQNREKHPNFVAWLDGTISYIEMANPPQGKKLRSEFVELTRVTK